MSASVKESGIVFLEVIVTLALLTLVIAALMTVFWIACYAFQLEMAESEAQYSVRNGMQKIIEDVRGCMEIEVEENGAKLKLSRKDNEVIYYYAENGQLYQDGKAKIPIAECISRLDFTYESNLLQISIEAEVKQKTYKISSSTTKRGNGFW